MGTRVVAAILTATATTVLALSASAAPATAASAPGVSAKSITVGFVSSQTGPAASTFSHAFAGCKAAIGLANAAGGVNGREINMVYSDDATFNNLVTTQELVQNKHVYAVVNDSPFFSATWRWSLDHNVPTIGAGYDGTEYGLPGNEKLISPFGNTTPGNGVTYDDRYKVLKFLGATKVAIVGYSTVSSIASVKNSAQYGAPAADLKAAYVNSSVDFGTTDVGPLVLGIKNSGADAGDYVMDANTNLALVQGLAQNGIKMKAQLLATGYGQDLLNQPVAKQLTSDVLVSSGYAPVELKTAATKRFQAALKKYGGLTGVPDFGAQTGYVDCDLLVLGLKAQGNNLDPNSFSDVLRTKVGRFNPGNGLGCQDLDLSPATLGKPAPTACSWTLQVKDGKFAVLEPPGGKTTYWSGKLIQASVPSGS